jgi:hypothetical protein
MSPIGTQIIINENSNKRNGVSIGGFININLRGNLNEENHPGVVTFEWTN